ncbi:hypothetical protein [Streptomyces sp. NPDC015131]
MKTHVHVWTGYSFVAFDPDARIGAHLIEVRYCGCGHKHVRPWRPE